MNVNILRRVSAVIASVALILAVTNPVAAYLSSDPGNLSCPSRPTGLHAYYNSHIHGWAPGQNPGLAFEYDASNWTARNIPGVIGGGDFYIEGGFQEAGTYVYCS